MSMSAGESVLSFFIVIVFFLLIGSRGACVSSDVAVRAAETQGYSDVQVTDHAWFMVTFRGCGEDAARFTVAAKNQKGKHVRFYVCAGWLLKSATIRTE